MASANGKGLYFYVAESAETHLVELDDVTLTLNIGGTAQNQPAGPATSPFWAQVSRGSTEYGLRPRKIGVCFTGTAPGTLEAGPTYNIVVLDPAEFNAATIGGTVQYQGEAAQIRTKTAESIYPGI